MSMAKKTPAFGTEPIAASTARANLFQIVRYVVRSRNSVTVISRDCGKVLISPCPSQEDEQPTAVVVKPKPKAKEVDAPAPEKAQTPYRFVKEPAKYKKSARKKHPGLIRHPR